MEKMRDNAVDGENGRKKIAVDKWVGLNPDRLKYEMIFAASDSVAFNQLAPAKRFIEGE